MAGYRLAAEKLGAFAAANPGQDDVRWTQSALVAGPAQSGLPSWGCWMAWPTRGGDRFAVKGGKEMDPLVT